MGDVASFGFSGVYKTNYAASCNERVIFWDSDTCMCEAFRNKRALIFEGWCSILSSTLLVFLNLCVKPWSCHHAPDSSHHLTTLWVAYMLFVSSLVNAMEP